jgi:chromate reductase
MVSSVVESALRAGVPKPARRSAIIPPGSARIESGPPPVFPTVAVGYDRRMTIIGISGSLRAGSYNTALLRAAVELAPSGCTVEPVTLREIPLFDGDLEQNRQFPEEVVRLKDRIAASQGLLLVTPEHNHSIPGVMKNAIDWLSRPPSDIPRVFRDRPVALMGASTGPRGTILAQTAWLPVIRTLGMRPWFGKQLYLAGAAGVFDAQGTLTDDGLRRRVREFMAGFAEFAAQQTRSG